MVEIAQYTPDIANASDLVTLNNLLMQYANGTFSPDAFNSAVDNWLVENKDGWEQKDLYDLFMLGIGK